MQLESSSDKSIEQTANESPEENKAGHEAFVNNTLTTLFNPILDVIDGKVDLDLNSEFDDNEEYDSE